MATVNTNYSRAFDFPRQQVLFDGRLRSDAYCTNVSSSIGLEGSTATVVLPAFLWDDDTAAFEGAFVEVRQDGKTVFGGFASEVASQLGPDLVQLPCRSVLALSDNVYIGQGGSSADYRAYYPREALNPATGAVELTGWTLKTILRDIFSSSFYRDWRGGGGTLPSDWRARLKLGDMTTLDVSFNQVEITSMTFERETLKDALQRILDMVGTISIREQFVRGGDAILHLFELANPDAPAKQCHVVEAGESVAGRNAYEASKKVSADGVKNRIVAMGDRERFLCLLTTTHPTAPLVRLWDQSLEAAVLANPELAQRDDAYGFVFRRYGIPRDLHDLIIEEDNAILSPTSGERLPIEAMFWPSDIAIVGSELVGTESATAKVVDVEFDLTANRYFVLSEPAIRVGTASIVDGKEQITFVEANVGLQCTFAARQLLHDTGASTAGNYRLSGISSGMTETIENKEFQFVQATNIGYEDLFGGHAFDALIYDEAGGAWLYYDTATVIRDDTALLQSFAEFSLEEKKNAGYDYSIKTPRFTTAYKLGDRIKLLGVSNFDGGTHQVKSISHELTNDHSTTISTSSSVPLIASSILGGE